MALVHKNLHKSKDLVRIDLQNYIETLSAQIRAQYGAERDIRFSVQAIGVEVDLEWETSETLGLKLIKMLGQQLNGTIEVDRFAGTIFRLRFAH